MIDSTGLEVKDIGFMWKVDFANAYDSLSWKFLWTSTRWKGFPTKWVVEQEMHHVSFILNAGERLPLAASLFVLTVDALAHSHCLLRGFQMPTFH